MNSKTWLRIIALTLFATLALPVSLAAQANATQNHKTKHHHYQLMDIGTFGGPSSYLYLPPFPRGGVLNNRGTVVGFADTATNDPLCFFSPDCYYTRGYQLQNGVRTDLSLLPGGFNSQGNWVSASGLIAGVADNGQPDPLGGIPVLHGVLYESGGITDLGTLEGGYFSFASAVNNQGEVVGLAENAIPDANSMVTGYLYQSRGFYWKNGVMQDIGTLPGGNDAQAALINERGQVVGWSYTNSAPSAICAGFGYGFSLTTSSFIWDRKNGMRDIGGLGGTCTLANDFNNRGQIVGGSALTGNLVVHPFVWNPATGVTDLLRASDGNYGFAEGENDRGEVAGGTCDPALCYALVWRKSAGKWHETKLGTIAGFGFAISINNPGQVVGNCGNCIFLWEDGGPMVDLNTLVPPDSGIQLVEVGHISDRGEIAAQGPDANGNNHAVLLIPCDENHPGVEGCDYGMMDAATLPQSATPSTEHPAVGNPRNRMPAGMLNGFRFRLGQRTPVFGNVPPPAAEQESPVNTDSVDVEGEQLLGPLAGRYKGYCAVYGGKVTGYCIAYSYYACLSKVSTACPSGKTATKPGYFQCANRGSRYVDLARGCGFN